MACGCFCCRKPRYKRLVDSLFPADPQDASPVASDMDKLLYFAKSSPDHLDRIGEYLAMRLRRSLHREKRGHTCVALKITEMLLSECDPQRLQLIANSYLDMLHVMLESPHTDMQIMATNSFVVFAEQEEDGTPYHRQYDFLIHRFAAMSLVPKNRDSQTFHEVRMAGLKGLRGVIKKTGREEGLQLNIWDINHMNKIVPPFLFNMQEHAAAIAHGTSETLSAGEGELAEYAEEGLKELIPCAGLAHIDSVIKPVLQHFDLNQLWTKQKDFAADAFVTIVETMQKQDRYKAIQALVDHLDAKSSKSCDLKQGILDTLSRCVAVAADGSLGPSVLDVFRTLVKHLRISIENSQTTEVSQDSMFQDSITRTMGEFAGVLPDYHKPDIMNLINSYMPSVSGSEQQLQPTAGDIGSPLLSSSLVKCLRAVADTYHPAVLETTFPEALFTSLIQLLKIKDANTQLDVSILWHQLIDHSHNKEKIPFNTMWKSLESCDLTLGKVSQRFLNKTRSSLYTHLYDHAMVLSMRDENLKAFYQLLFLLTLEFSHPGVTDMVNYLSQLQDLAQAYSVDMSTRHRIVLHVTAAGILYLIAKMTSNQALQDHILEVINRRQNSAPELLPDSFFTPEGSDGPEASLENLDPKLLFQLKERGLLEPPPEQKKGLFREFSRDYSASQELTQHFSVSLDYGPDSPLSVDQINFHSFKEKVEMMSSGDTHPRGRGSSRGERPAPGGTIAPTFEEMVGRSSMHETGLAGIADILNTTSPSELNVPPEKVSDSAYDIELPVLH